MKRFSAALLGVLIMTAPNINTGGLDLPAAIAEVPTSSVIARIGIVSDIVEADNITVKISGSNVLVQASYLFPQYEPLLGDIVYVTKQDAQWMVLGTMSGPVNSLVPNPSFENGTAGVLPDDWTLNVTSSGAGVPTFTKVTTNDNPISGLAVADFGVDNAGAAGLSEAEAISSIVPATPGERWSAACYLTNAFISVDNASQGAEGAPTFFDIKLEFLDAANVSLSIVTLNTVTLNTSFYSPIYLRPATATPYVSAPAGTAGVRVRFEADFFMSATSFTSIFIDQVYLRKFV
jgi:hypothetical protein